ncbi:HEAT repeat domain-containing protein [Armatimonas sp.]|uniref:HEAT repeat domain-containing protein n=1 Tax=Armatimonas sp. TaxID=1872638 RepID=UPI00374D1407
MFAFIRDVRCEAAEALGKLGDERGIAALLALCWDKDTMVRSDAINSLGLLGDEREAPSFEVHSDVRRYSASEGLCNLDEMLSQVLTILISVCENKRERPYVRCHALTALGNIGNAHPTVIAALNSLLLDSQEEVCCTATQILGKLGYASEEVLDALYQKLETGDGSNGDWLGLLASAAALRTREVEAWAQAQEV